METVEELKGYIEDTETEIADKQLEIDILNLEIKSYEGRIKTIKDLTSE